MNWKEYRPITDAELKAIVRGMEQAERLGMFESLFKGPLPPVDSGASTKELLHSISPSMRLTIGFFKRIYGYELTWPGFAEEALTRLEVIAGCGLARKHYAGVKAQVNYEYEKGLKEAAQGISRQRQRQEEQERGEELRAKKLDSMSVEELLILLQRSIGRA